MTCILAASRCVGWDGDCRTLPPDLVPLGVSRWWTCERYPGAGLADAAWHLAKRSATWSWVSGQRVPEPWAVRDVAASDRWALVYASTATWLEGVGLQRCEKAPPPREDGAFSFELFGIFE